VSQAQRIGQFIRAYRKKLDLTQDALAKRAGLPVDSIRKYEGGRRADYLYLYTAEKLANALELAPGSPERETFLDIVRAKAPVGGRRKDPRTRLIEQVREFWVDGVLDHGLRSLDYINLRMSLTSRRTTATQNTQPAPTEELRQSIHNVFTDTRSVLLILGQPGSGKTMTLLELARVLLDSASEDLGAPIPVVLPLASWAEDQLLLQSWIEDELARTHFVPRALSEELLENGGIVPLLDGLDEVRPDCREACVEAINAFSRTAIGRLVVCCRTSVYAGLEARLTADIEATLQPLDDNQIETVLSGAGRQLTAVRALLQKSAPFAPGATSPGSTLRELAASPLMLNIIVQSLDGVSIDELALSGSLEAQRRHLLDIYTTRMLQPRGYGVYPPYRIRAALSWMAQHLQRTNQSLFFLDQLQPTWLSSKAARRTYYLLDRLGAALCTGFLLGGSYAAVVVGYGLFRRFGAVYWTGLAADLLLMFVLGGILGGLFGGHPEKRLDDVHRFWSHVRERIVGWVTGGLFTGAAILLLTRDVPTALLCSLTGALAGILMGRPTFRVRTIILVEERRWSWERIVRLLPAYLSAGVVVGLLIGFSIGQVDGLLGRILPPVAASVTAGLVTGVLASVVFGVTYRDDETRVIPNQGIWRSGRNALRASLEGAFGGALFGLLVLAGPVAWMITGLMGGVLGALASGAITVISHVALRATISQHTPFPFNSLRFLDHAVERDILQRVGGGFQFSHPLLRDHFAHDTSVVPLDTANHAQSRVRRASKWSLLGHDVIGFAVVLLLTGVVGQALPRQQPLSLPPTQTQFVIDANRADYTGFMVSALDVRPGDTVELLAAGEMAIGAFSRHVGPIGMERGGLGFPLGDGFKIDPDFPTGALLCRVTGEKAWRLCGEKTAFVASQQGALEFLVNDTAIAIHEGRYVVAINIVRRTVPSTAPP
jgi:eukaryotic-like serine/threonine-protein kinase